MNWMISANPKMYRHADAFNQFGYIDWRQKANYNKGDIVYIYCTKPYQKVMFKTKVEIINMPFNAITDDKDFWKIIEEYDKAKDGKYCRLRLIEQADSEMLTHTRLLENGLKAVPQGPKRLNDELVCYIDNFLRDCYSDGFFNDIPANDLMEGIKHSVTVNRYERSSIARRKCVEDNGCICKVCGIDFEKVYGNLGKDFIHIHHIVPMAEINRSYKIDYKNDLIPLCPNCHAMIHRKLDGKFVSWEELKCIYFDNRKNKSH